MYGGGQYIQEGQIQAGQTDQAGWRCGWPEAGLPGDGGREEDYGQTIGHYGQCHSPFVRRLQRTEEPVQ